jgi:hypothetical protein
MPSPKYLQSFQKQFNNLLNSGEGEKIRKIFSIDGKTQCGNGNDKQNANHIVSVVDENGFCLGQEPIKDKSKELCENNMRLFLLKVRVIPFFGRKLFLHSS